MGVIEYVFKIKIADRLDHLIALPVLAYRRLRYGYAFRRIPLTQNKYAIVDPDDYPDLAKHRWYARRDGNTFYAARTVRNKDGKRRPLAMHRQILKVADGMLVDHINGNGLENRKANLRPATVAQNIRNRTKFDKRAYVSKYKGVSHNSGKKRWQAEIYVNSRRIFLGCFEDEAQAAKAYDRAAKKYHGEFASPNFPDAAPRSRWKRFRQDR